MEQLEQMKILSLIYHLKSGVLYFRICNRDISSFIHKYIIITKKIVRIHAGPSPYPAPKIRSTD